MGTRSLTYIVDGEKPIACMYRQYDGYLSGHGAELAKFLDGAKIVNGIGGDAERVFNGLGDLGVRLITHLKGDAETPGGFYLTDPTTGEAQEYNYFVSIEGDPYSDPENCSILIKVFTSTYESGDEKLGNEIFRGTPAELLAFKEEEED